jgi:ubiquinone/menaquinone biosynthesis C-methylase UbiE
MEPQLKNDTILDLGCGTAVFSLFYLLKAKASRVKLYLVDISDKILGNAIFNCRQSSLWSSLEIIAIC